MKILVYTHEYMPFEGGVATYNYELASGLSELGHDVTVLAPCYSPSDKLMDNKADFAVRREKFPTTSCFSSYKKISQLLYSSRVLISCIKKMRPEMVIVTNQVAHESAAIAAAVFKFNYIVTIHGGEIRKHLDTKGVLGYIRKKLLTNFLNKSKKLCCVSNSTKRLLEKHYNSNVKSKVKNRILVVHLGIGGQGNAKSRKTGWEGALARLKNRKVIMTVARLCEGKGQDTVIKSLPGVLKRIPNLIYLIVGEGPERANLEKLAEELGVEKAVLFLGHIDRVRLCGLYSACDVFIMLSSRGVSESFGLVYLEAWAQKKPVIAGKTGGVTEVISNNIDGLIIDPKDIEKTQESIIRLIRDKKLAQYMGANGYNNIKDKFSRKNMAEKTVS